LGNLWNWFPPSVNSINFKVFVGKIVEKDLVQLFYCHMSNEIICISVTLDNYGSFHYFDRFQHSPVVLTQCKLNSECELHFAFIF
jgi:hypothetical protein